MRFILILHFGIKINWKETINNIFLEANIELNGTETIYVSEKSVLKKLVNILGTFDVRTIGKLFQTI